MPKIYKFKTSKQDDKTYDFVNKVMIEFFEYEEKIESSILYLMNHANSFDQKEVERLIDLTNSMEVDIASVMPYLHQCSKICHDSNLEREYVRLLESITKAFAATTCLTDMHIVVKDELKKMKDKLNVYVGMIYDFSREFKRKFVE